MLVKETFDLKLFRLELLHNEELLEDLIFIKKFFSFWMPLIEKISELENSITQFVRIELRIIKKITNINPSEESNFYKKYTSFLKQNRLLNELQKQFLKSSIQSLENNPTFKNISDKHDKIDHFYIEEDFAIFREAEGNYSVFLLKSGSDYFNAPLLQAFNFILSEKLVQKGVVILHASAIDFNNRGFLFIGRSGSGKTTIANRLSEKGCHKISEEMVLLYFNKWKKKIFIYPFPFNEDVSLNNFHELSKIFLLDPSENYGIFPIASDKKLTYFQLLFDNFFFHSFYEKKNRTALFELALDLCNNKMQLFKTKDIFFISDLWEKLNTKLLF